MKKNLNNKGFTLIEVLAVIVLLAVIMAIALPNITGSLDRQSCKMVESRAKLIESAAQFYVSDHRTGVKNKLHTTNHWCKISTDKLIETKDIVQSDLGEGKEKIEGYIVYDQDDESYTFCVQDLDSLDNVDDGVEILDSCNINEDVAVCASASIASVPLCYDVTP